MTFSSILFDIDDLPKETAEPPTCFTDLNLDQVVEAVTARKKDYHLKPFFHTPLRSADTIRYRHEVMRDLRHKGLAFCYPQVGADKDVFVRDSFDLALAHAPFFTEKPVICNDFALTNPERIIVVTGANQGGKTTFLHSIGLAQLMMQCGMFVPAESFSANLCRGLFTHYKREEDASMTSGKFDEELSRMSAIADQFRRGCVQQDFWKANMPNRNDRYRHFIRNRFRKVVLSKDMETFLLISLGAIFGANLRYWIGVWAAGRLGTSFPYGNLIINLTGSFILGFFMTLAVERLLLDPRWRILFAVGFLGSYTTFSSYTFESLSLILDNQWLFGLLNLFGSAFLGGVAVFLGIILARAI